MKKFTLVLLALTLLFSGCRQVWEQEKPLLDKAPDVDLVEPGVEPEIPPIISPEVDPEPMIIRPFQLVYQVEAGMKIDLPLHPSGSYNFYVRWEEGEFGRHIDSAGSKYASYVYETAGEKIVEIWADTINGMTFSSAAPWSYAISGAVGAGQLVDVLQFGDVRFINNMGTFAYCSNLVSFSAPDAPYLKDSVETLFSSATSFNDPLGGWDFSRVTSLSGVFQDATAFNQDISSWDTSSVADMSRMFYNATAFNQDLSGWNVAKVINTTSFAVGTSATWTLPKPIFP